MKRYRYKLDQRTKKNKIAAISIHDLWRTAAALTRRNRASIEQVQVMLGHACPQTTGQYIGEELDLDEHTVDYAKIVIPGDW